jgi:hypothetical protein
MDENCCSMRNMRNDGIGWSGFIIDSMINAGGAFRPTVECVSIGER